MIVRKFMRWAAEASAGARAEGAGALARAFLFADLTAPERAEAEIALTNLLDDPSPLVRKALADAFASATDAPQTIVAALANDQSTVAAPILSRSPLLSDAELIDCAAIGDAFAQAAIAVRPHLSASVSAALAEVGACEALIALAVNSDAELAEFSMRRMVERHGEDAELREAMLSRDHLPPAVRSDLVAVTARVLTSFVTGCNWLSPERADRVLREARDKAHVIIASDVQREGDWAGALALAAHLRASGQLTTSLVMRAILSGNACLFEAALVELSNLPERHVIALARDFRGSGFATLYRASGLPQALLPAFKAALAAYNEAGNAGKNSARLSRMMIERVLTACEAINAGELNTLLALLRRFDAEAARENARDAMIDMLSPQVSAQVSAPAFQIDLVALEAELAA